MFLYGQISKDMDYLKNYVRTDDDKKLNKEEIDAAFNKFGRLKYDAEKQQLGILNTSTKHLNYKIPKTAVANITLRIPDQNGVTVGTSNGIDYLNYVDAIYAQNPEDPYINVLMSNFYDTMDVYGNQFVQSAPETSSTAIVK